MNEEKEEVKTIKPTIKIPSWWIKLIEEYMKENAINSFSELIRYLIRKEIIEKK